MLLRPFEVLVPREHKPAYLQERFDLLATEQVHGKEKLCGPDTQTRCFSTDSFDCTSVPDTSADDQCTPDNGLQVVRDWMAQRKQRSVLRQTKILQARNLATWLRQKELDDRKQKAPWVGGSKNMSRKGLGPNNNMHKIPSQQLVQSGSRLPATTVDPYWEVACSKVQLAPSRPQPAHTPQKQLGGMICSEHDVLDDLTAQLDNLNKKCKRVQKQGSSRTHSQHCRSYKRSEHIQALHARAKAYTNYHKL